MSKVTNIFRYYSILVYFCFFSIKGLTQETFRDNFSSVSYTNSDGTQDWSGNSWIEEDDTNLGPTSQYIYINNNRLTFNWIFTESIGREADLNGATSATLAFFWQTSGLNGSKGLRIQVSSNGGASFTTVGTIGGNNSSGNFSTNISGFISTNTVVRFTNTGTNWDSNDFAFIDNFQISVDQLSPEIQLQNVTVNEDAGTVAITAMHSGASASGSFSVNYATVDGSAVAGNDYSSTTGVLNFNGNSGDTETIIVPIINDGLIEPDESFTIQLSSSTDNNVDISDIGTVTINSQIPFNQPLTLYEQYAGYLDYTSAAGTFRVSDNNTDPCAINTTSSGTLISNIPNTGTIQKAYLYWAHSSYAVDRNITFQGQNVTSDLIYESGISVSGVNRTFYGYVSDVTTIIESIGVNNLSSTIFNVTDLTIDNSTNYCSTATVLGGWSLMIFYEDNSLPAANINLYLGFDGLSNAGTSFTLDAFYAISGTGSKASFLSWEGDATLDGSSSGSVNPEELSVTNQSGLNFVLSGDGGQPGNNAYNSTIFDNSQGTTVNLSNIHGVDWDTYDISAFIAPTDTQVTANVDVGQDFVVSNAVVLKVPSNLVTGYVFEDINYPGGNGRNRLVSSGIGIEGVTVELYNSINSLINSTTTNSNGQYTFGGMPDGTYSVRVVNSTITSSRGGGETCTSCMPIQTFRTFNIGLGNTEVVNEVGGANPQIQDSNAGSITGAQSVSQVTLASNGIVGIDFGFNFNTIVNTNEDGQGSLEQFIINANNLDETGLDIQANSIFNPSAGEDTSIFMIPSSSDPLGRTADSNFSNGYFDIEVSAFSPLSSLIDDNTVIDGRTQTAYSGDTNSGSVTVSTAAVGVSNIALPNYNLPEIQVRGNGGDILKIQGNNTAIRYISIYANNNAGIRVDGGSVSVIGNLIGVNAEGNNSGNIDIAIENLGGDVLIDSNYIATNTDSGILIDAGSSNIIQNNAISDNGDAACDDNILITGGSGIQIQQNLIENASSLGIDAATSSGAIIIFENTIAGSGQNGGNCGGEPKQMGIELGGSNSQITNNVIYSNGGAGIAITGSGNENLISQNAIYANGTASDALGIDLNNDGVTLNDNNDSDTGANDLLNFPIITAVNLSGTNVIITGWSRPGATLEFFLSDINEGSASTGDNQLGNIQDYGEGQIYFGSATEGGVEDGSSSVTSYTDMDGNTDNTNYFQFVIPLPPGTNLGEIITSTATLSNSTSEFSPGYAIKAARVITNRRITYRVNQ